MLAPNEEPLKKEVLIKGTGTQHTMVDDTLCIHADCLRCRVTSVAGKKQCNSYECPYHPFNISDHWG